jgi:hypothetical protein
MSEDTKPKEIVVPLSEGPGKSLHAARVRETGADQVEVTLGTISPMEHGKPLNPGTDLVELTPCEDAPVPVYHAKTLYESPKPQASGAAYGKPRSCSSEEWDRRWALAFGKGNPEMDPTLN